jgi:hypothetical protein
MIDEELDPDKIRQILNAIRDNKCRSSGDSNNLPKTLRTKVDQLQRTQRNTRRKKKKSNQN